MEFELKLSEDDFLQFQLYTASQSPRIKKKRSRSFIIVIAMFLMLSYLFWSQGNMFLMWAFLFWVLLSILFYPLYERRRYRKHYEGFIQENYQGKIGEKGYFRFEADRLFSKSRGSEGYIDYAEMDKIVEIASHFFLYLKSGVAFVLPKSEFEKVDDLRKFLFQLSENHNIEFSSETDWKWK